MSMQALFCVPPELYAAAGVRRLSFVFAWIRKGGQAYGKAIDPFAQIRKSSRQIYFLNPELSLSIAEHSQKCF